jgi:hypothetical protein
MLRVAACIILLAFNLASIATERPVNLWCARGVADYPDAAMTLNPQGSHVVNVVFVGYRPSRARAEWSLRDCLYTASRLDASRDIVARLWYRDREPYSPHEPLQPHALVYNASSKDFAVPDKGIASPANRAGTPRHHAGDAAPELTRPGLARRVERGGG